MEGHARTGSLRRSAASVRCDERRSGDMRRGLSVCGWDIQCLLLLCFFYQSDYSHCPSCSVVYMSDAPVELLVRSCDGKHSSRLLT